MLYPSVGILNRFKTGILRRYQIVGGSRGEGYTGNLSVTERITSGLDDLKRIEGSFDAVIEKAKN